MSSLTLSQKQQTSSIGIVSSEQYIPCSPIIAEAQSRLFGTNCLLCLYPIFDVVTVLATPLFVKLIGQLSDTEVNIIG